MVPKMDNNILYLHNDDSFTTNLKKYVFRF